MIPRYDSNFESLLAWENRASLDQVVGFDDFSPNQTSELLVGSLLRGGPIPEVYFERQREQDGKPAYLVHCGRFCLFSVLSFILRGWALPSGERFALLPNWHKRRLRETIIHGTRIEGEQAIEHAKLLASIPE